LQKALLPNNQRAREFREYERPRPLAPNGSPSNGCKTPELNDIEVVSHDLKAHHLVRPTFGNPEALDRAIHDAVTTLNTEQNPDPLVKQRISA
jgi:hypothetical protein